MSDFKTTRWTIFNTLGRLVGAGFVLVGVIIFIFGLVRSDGLIAVPALVVAVLGVLLLCARPSSLDSK
jgi:hypothetical protein